VERTGHVLISILLFLLLVGFGCAGYMVIEGWNFMDALYMTVITLATVGYGEVHSVGSVGRIFTLALIILGGGFFVYAAGNIIQFLVEGRIREIMGRRKLDTQLKKVHDHYIVCGYGRIGRVLTSYLTQRYLDVVVIERSREGVDRLHEDGVLYIEGEATEDAVLEKAGIASARALITAVATDADNVFLVLTARRLNPDIYVVARASRNQTKKTLMAAGADKVISPYDIGARRMAHAILRPTVIEFLELAFADDDTDIQMEEIRVAENSDLVGVALKDSRIRQNLDLIILSIRKADATMLFNPGAETELEAGETVVVVGRARSLKRLERILAP
jgi:voltage-gated potassium channel